VNNPNGLKTILIIDDEEIIRQSFCDQLEDLGYQVMVAENGCVGVEILKNEALDLILTDLRMPEMGGLEVIQQSKEIKPDIPIIVISGAGRIDDAVEALRRGADDYLVKPVNDLAMLQHSIEKTLEKAELRHDNLVYQERLEDLVRDRTSELERANLQMAQVNSRLRSIVIAGSNLSGCFYESTFASRIFKEFAKSMKASGGSIYKVETKGLRLMQTLDPGHALDFIPFPLLSNSVFQKALNHCNPMLIKNIKAEGVFIASGWNGYEDISSLIFSITDSSGSPSYLLSLHNKTKPPFGEQDKEIGSILASFGSETLRVMRAFDSLRASDKRYRMLFDKTNDAIFLVNRENGCFEDANEAATKLSGRTLEELQTLTIRDITQGQYDNEFNVAEEVSQVMGSGPVTFVRPDGSERVARLNSILLNKSTSVDIARDITEEHAMEEQLRRVQKMDAVGQLTGGIAHDFNNILGIVLGNLSLLERRINNDEDALKRVKTIKKSAERAAALTKQLLSFSRKQDARLSIVDANQVITGMDNLIARSLTPEIEIEYVSTEEIWSIEVDSGGLEDVLLNLVINARDAMPKGGKLTIETCNFICDERCRVQYTDVEPGDYVQLVVSDTGEGMSSKVQEHIFEPFFTTKAQGKGTGLGLAMVFGFVKRSHGHVKVSSEQGYGTTFKLFFPRTEGKGKLTNSSSVPLIDIPTGNETILVVDDEEDLLEMAKDSLGELGYNVLIAGNGEKALEQLEKNADIKLLFSDVVMPGGINGYELSEQANSRWPEIKILLSSGFTGNLIAESCPHKIDFDLISKPYSLSNLAQRVRLLLGNIDVTTIQKSGQKGVDSLVIKHNAKEGSVSPGFDWEGISNIGIQSVDDDHKQLLLLCNRSQSLVNENEPPSNMLRIHDELAEYIRDHFSREESVMEACNYPDLENHKQVHIIMMRKLSEMRRQITLDQISPDALFNFIKDWWIDHIRTMDLDMANYCCNKHGQTNQN